MKIKHFFQKISTQNFPFDVSEIEQLYFQTITKESSWSEYRKKGFLEMICESLPEHEHWTWNMIKEIIDIPGSMMKKTADLWTRVYCDGQYLGVAYKDMSYCYNSETDSYDYEMSEWKAVEVPENEDFKGQIVVKTKNDLHFEFDNIEFSESQYKDTYYLTLTYNNSVFVSELDWYCDAVYFNILPDA